MKLISIFLFILFIGQFPFVFAQGIEAEPGVSIYVESGTTLDISGGGDLILRSNAIGDASLIDLGTVSYTGGGEAQVERYLTNGKWHLISSPVEGSVAGMFENDYLQSHDETSNLYSDIESSVYELNPVQGYALWTVDASASAELFIGNTFTGDQTYDFTQNASGFNLVGNPYPSVLDWEAVTIPAQLNGAIWLFDPSVGDNGDFKYYISGGGGANTTTQYIPSGQGFFVYATGGNGRLELDNSVRTHGGQEFYKSVKSHPMLVLKATGNQITTQTAIRFIPESTNEVDRLFDVNKIVSNSTNVPVVYSKCDNDKMAINTLPAIEGNEKIPLFFEAGTDGSYTFLATEIESIDANTPVYLEDVANDYIQDLRSNPEYSFNYSSGAVKDFIIHFKDVTGLDELDAQTRQFNCWLSDGILKVYYQGQQAFQGKALIDVYNLAGQHILQKESTQAHYEINLSEASAMYLIRVQYQQNSYSTKVINR